MTPPVIHQINSRAPSGGSRSTIGAILVEEGKLTEEDVESVLRLQVEIGAYFGEAAKRLGLIDDADIRQVLAKQFGFSTLDPRTLPYKSELLAAYQPFSESMEALRSVRTQLALSWLRPDRNSLAVMAPESGEGASFICANLAILFAQMGKSTLLVDANLRNPRQHKMFGLAVRHGLSDILASRAGLDLITQIENFTNLYVLAAGTVPPNPQELVGSDAFYEFGQSVRKRFDVVLYDAPSFSVGADALSIPHRTGRAALLVARRDRTRAGAIAALRRQLTQIGVETVGCVLTEF